MKRHELQHAGVRPATSEEAAADWLKRYEVLEQALVDGTISQKQYDERRAELAEFTGYDRPIAPLKRKPLGRPRLRLSKRRRRVSRGGIVSQSAWRIVGDDGGCYIPLRTGMSEATVEMLTKIARGEV